MSLWTNLLSQLVNLKAFRPFFPLARTIGDFFVLPVHLLGSGGRANAFPFVINFHVTTQCNLKCYYCFNAANCVPGADELPLEFYRGLAERWARHRPGIFISGGEPLARPDLPDIIEAFKRQNLPVAMVTNGTLLDEAQVRHLAHLGLDIMLVSFHGVGPTHDEAVGQAGAYRKSMQALRWWHKYRGGRSPMINYIISPASVKDLPRFMDEVADLRLTYLRMSHFNFLTPEEINCQKEFWRGRFDETPLEILSYQYKPETAAFEPLFDFLRSEKGRQLFIKPKLNDRELRQWYSSKANLDRRCVFIWRSTFVNAQGDVYPCQSMYLRLGNLRQQSMEEIWNNELYCKFRKEIKQGLMPGCARCCKN